MLITNSDYLYTNKMMSFAYNRFMPPGKTWRDLFDMVSLRSKGDVVHMRSFTHTAMQVDALQYCFIMQVNASVVTYQATCGAQVGCTVRQLIRLLL